MRVNFVVDTMNHLVRQVPMEIEVPRCQDINSAAYFTNEDYKVPLGSQIITTWHGGLGGRTDGGSGTTDWVGLYKAGDCANATAINIESLHKCYLAWKTFPRHGLKEARFAFDAMDYKQEPGYYEVRYFTNLSSPAADTWGVVCGGGIGSEGRLSLEGYYGMCWLDVYATSPPIQVSREENYPGLMPDRHPFNGNSQSVPGLELDSLEG